MELERTLRYIGIAKKAGRLVTGTPAVCDALRRREGDAVFMACDVSDSTEKRLADKCSFYGARLYRLGASASELAHVSGKTGAVAAVMITDAGLSASAKQTLTAESTLTSEKSMKADGAQQA